MRLRSPSFVHLAAVLALVATLQLAAEDAKPNPYESIAERNPFGLKPPPPPPDPNAAAATPPPPLATVEVTGILNLLSSKKVLLEIVPGPGKPAVKPTLSEGERVDAVEVISIDVELGEVTINNGGVVTNLALKTPKAGGPAPGAPGALPIPPPVANTAYAPAQPNTVYGGTLANANTSGRAGVTVAGGSPAVVPAGAQPYGANPATYGGPGAYVPNQPGAAAAPNANPLVSGGDYPKTIPTRPIRPTPQAPAQPQGVSVDPAVQYINMAVQKQQAEARGKPFPPLPPIPGLNPEQ